MPRIDQRRPDGAADIVAARGDRDGQSPVAVEPVRGFRHQRTEGRRRAQSDGEMHQDELPDRRRHPGADIAEAEDADAEPDRGDDAVAVADLAGQHAAGAEAEHHKGKGQRGRSAGGAEFGLHHGQGHYHRPHADAAERADDHGHGKPEPRPARVGNEQVGISGERRRNIHGARNFDGLCLRVNHHGVILGMQMRWGSASPRHSRMVRSTMATSRADFRLPGERFAMVPMRFELGERDVPRCDPNYSPLE